MLSPPASLSNKPSKPVSLSHPPSPVISRRRNQTALPNGKAVVSSAAPIRRTDHTVFFCVNADSGDLMLKKANSKAVDSSTETTKHRGRSVISSAKVDDVLFFKDVKLGPQEGELRFRLIHYWEARNAFSKTLIGLEMLLIDEQGTVDELKASYGAKELVQPKKGVTDFMEDLNPANDLKPTHNLDTPTAMEFPGDKGFTNGMTSANGVTYPAVVQLEKRDGQKINASDEHKLVKDIEEMKVKVKALESKLQQADSTISKLMEERSIGSQHRESLQQELADLRTKKIVKEKHIGFPLLFVCMVAFINIVIGYGLRT
ncbi:hypothetical protein F2Q68_00042632 [Brassica cretica]|uniref:Uncharacterized protein n=1 Tax=Brassica cretica TaxID=69181 RepID=A0A8S9M9J0_BRACR|nr:hypothetical protein F2Q68_00042632 [Brassica cretica]